LNELDNTVTVLTESASGDTWDSLQTLSLLAPDFRGCNTAAGIALHPNGRFLFASNRGADDIVALSIDAATKMLTRIGAVPAGDSPRFFTIDHSGKWLLAAAQCSETITVFRIDAQTGHLKAVSNPLRVPAPVFIGVDEAAE
jgi:6-phosphogluconolactonase